MADTLRHLWTALITLLLLRSAIVGYLRRRPYWTRASWSPFATACFWPAVAVVICLGMSAAVDYRIHSLVGAGGSFHRLVWVIGAGVAGLWGAWGLGRALVWLHLGEPSGPFTRRLFSPPARSQPWYFLLWPSGK